MFKNYFKRMIKNEKKTKISKPSKTLNNAKQMATNS